MPLPSARLQVTRGQGILPILFTAAPSLGTVPGTQYSVSSHRMNDHAMLIPLPDLLKCPGSLTHLCLLARVTLILRTLLPGLSSSRIPSLLPGMGQGRLRSVLLEPQFHLPFPTPIRQCRGKLDLPYAPPHPHPLPHQTVNSLWAGEYKMSSIQAPLNSAQCPGFCYCQPRSSHV